MKRQGLRIYPHVLPMAERSGVPCEMGWFEVPENRRTSSSRNIEIAFIRFSTTNPEPGPPIITLEGGPGAKSIDTCTLRPNRYLDLREFGDSIVLDQRGVGFARPNLTGPFRMELPLDRVVTEDEYVAEFARKTAETAAFWRERGVDLHGYTTQENADDVAALMEALGYDKFRTNGGSYGSHLSLSVIRRHSERIDRSFIFMVEGPDDTFKLPSNVETNLTRISRLAASAPELEGRVPDLKSLIAEVLDQLRREPAEVDGVVVGEFDVKLITADRMGDLSFIKKLPALYLGMKAGDFKPWGARVKQGRTQAMPNLMTLLMDCASGASAERLRQIREEAKTTLLSDLINLPFPDVCPALGGPDAGDDFRTPVVSDVPALFASGTLDGRTPYSNAEAVMKGFSHKHHILVENAAHQDVMREPEILALVREFMNGRPVTTTDVRLDFAFEAPT